MRFIRDIINEKTQAAAQDGADALRYPLRLNEEDRTDLEVPQHSPVSPASDAPHAPVALAEEARPDMAPAQAAPAPETFDEAFSAQEQTFQDALEDALEDDAAPEVAVKPAAPVDGAEVAMDPAADDAAEIAPEPQLSDLISTVREETQTAPAVPEPAAAQNQSAAQQPAPSGEVDLASLPAAIAAHKPAGGRAAKGRVKTRLLGFSAPQNPVSDPMQQSPTAMPVSQPQAQPQFPVGWLVVVDGPGRGASFSLFDGLTQIGRGEGQTVRLDFGDNTISRENHAAIAFDGEQRRFFFGHGGKANLVRLNGRPVLSTEDLADNSVIRIGETTLRFVALCGEDFTWSDTSMAAEQARHG